MLPYACACSLLDLVLILLSIFLLSFHAINELHPTNWMLEMAWIPMPPKQSSSWKAEVGAIHPTTSRRQGLTAHTGQRVVLDLQRVTVPQLLQWVTKEVCVCGGFPNPPPTLPHPLLTLVYFFCMCYCCWKMMRETQTPS